MIKKTLLVAAMLLGSSFLATQELNAKTNLISGNVASTEWCVHISDLSGKTNIRSSASGRSKIAMRLWEWTDYDIYVTRNVNGWLQISSIYNRTRGYWVKLHGSRTGYWISESIVY